MAAGAALLFVAAPALAQSEPPGEVDPIRFGATVSLTGALAAEAQTSKDGYDFIVDKINEMGGIPVGDTSYPIEIVYYDDQSDADLAVQLYQKLIEEDDVDFLLGPYSSGVTNAVSTVAEQNGIPMVVAHAATTSIYERGYRYLFGVLNTVDQYSEPLFEMASQIEEDPPTTVAIVHEDALFPTAFADAAEQLAGEYGFEVVYKQSFPQGVDFSSLMAAVAETDPDIVLSGGYTLGMIELVNRAAEQDVSFPMWMFSLGPTVPGFLEAVGENGENLLEPIQWAPNFAPDQEDEIFGWTAAEYAELFAEEKGYVPDYHPPQSSAAIEVYYKALGEAGTLDRDQVRDAIAAVDLTSFYGQVCFDERGVEACKSMGIAQIQDGKPVVVWPEEYAEAPLVYPNPGP
jgi:branched-chain amino acid transport system substrate-binding protein